MMDEELIRSLRICGNWEHQVRVAGSDLCDGCKYQVDGDCKSFKGTKELLLNEAADAIEELQQIAEHYEEAAHDYFKDVCYYLERVPKWIPVTEALPLYGQDVLAVRTYGDGEKCQEVLMAHIAVWNEGTGEKWWSATNITHWMPLPNPPKEEIE